MVLNLIKKSRTHRHFYNDSISKEQILRILNGARYAACGKNRQALRFSYTIDDTKCQEIFKNISLGGALKVDEKPTIDERPRAFISISIENSIKENISSLFFDMGIATQNMILVANDLGFNTCIIMAFNKKINEILELPDNFSTNVLIAIGKGKEEVKVVDIHSNEDSKYYRKNGVHFVPKIILEELILK